MKLKITFASKWDDIPVEWEIAKTPLARKWAKQFKSRLEQNIQFNLDRSYYSDTEYAEQLLRYVHYVGQRFARNRYGQLTLENLTPMALNNVTDLILQVRQSPDLPPEDYEGLADALAAIKDLRSWVSLRGMREYGVNAHGRFYVNTEDPILVPFKTLGEHDLTTDIHMGGIYAVLRYDKVAWNDIEPMVEASGIAATYEKLLEKGIGGPSHFSTNFEILFEPNITGLDSKILATLQMFQVDAIRLGCDDPIRAVSEAGKLHIADLIGDFDPKRFEEVKSILKVELI